MWATEHALIDPFRFQFTTRAFKAAYGAEQVTGAAQFLQLLPPWMREAGYGASRLGAAELQSRSTGP